LDTLWTCKIGSALQLSVGFRSFSPVFLLIRQKHAITVSQLDPEDSGQQQKLFENDKTMKVSSSKVVKNLLVDFLCFLLVLWLIIISHICKTMSRWRGCMKPRIEATL